MASFSVLDPANLPDTALPFVRELMLEILRRVPANLGTPPRFATDDLGDAHRCADSARSLVEWFDTVPDALVQRVEELETVFLSLQEQIRGLDAHLRRAVFHSRVQSEEASTFVRSLSEVLTLVRNTLAGNPESISEAEILSEILRRMDARQGADEGARQKFATHFDRVQDDLDGLRREVTTLEQQARKRREQGHRDPLTSLCNRRGYENRLAAELARARRYHFPVSVVLWDVDQLARINGQHGHTAGDLVLQTLAGRVLSMLRKGDFMARTGGKEFAVILSSTAALQARLAAEKIRHHVATTPVPTSAGQLRVSASIGVAEMHSEDSPAALHRRASRDLAGDRERFGGSPTPRAGRPTH